MEEQKIQFKKEASKEEQLKWFVKTYPKLRNVANIQLEKINIHKQSKIRSKEVLHIYLYCVFEDFWNKADFFYSLRRNKYRIHNGLIIRSILEELLQLCYFTSISKDEKNLLVHKEHIRIYKKFYDRDLSSSEDGAYWQDEYDKYLQVLGSELPNDFPVKLSNLYKKHIEPFLNADKMCETAKKIMPWSKATHWYHDYRYFCEETHNGLMISTQRKPKDNYRQNLGYCLSYCVNMLKMTDRYYLNYETHDILKEVLESTNINNIKYK